MADLGQVMAPLGAECDADDVIADVLDDLRAQHPVPLVVTEDGAVVGTLTVDAVLAAYDEGLDVTRVREHMLPAPSADRGERPLYAAGRMRDAGSRAVVVTEPEGGVFSRRVRPAGIVSELQL